LILQIESVWFFRKKDRQMVQYEDTSDAAYRDGGLDKVSISERELFERTMTAVGVPPTLRPRARRNLLIKLVEGGESAVTEILEKSLDNRQRAQSWLDQHAGQHGPRASNMSL
jgi:hypothetical protein